MRLKRLSKRSIFIFTGIFGILLVVVGSGVLYWEKRLSFPTDVYTNRQSSSSSQFFPARINIGSVGIDLSVEEGKIDSGIWQISDKNATYLIGSDVPGRSGNIIIYGHNKWEIFGKLGTVGEGNVVEIFTKGGKEFRYRVVSISVVDPTDIGVIAPTNYQVLTIYTCTGFLDSKRLVVKAVPLS